MILAPHMLVGAAIGSQVPNWWIIFILGLMLHLLTDRLPHWEYEKNIESLPAKKLPAFSLKVLLDLTFGSIMIWWLAGVSPFLNYILFGAFVSLLPDGLAVLNQITRQQIKILRQFQSFHKKINNSGDKNSPIGGLAVEATIVILAIYLILKT